MAIHFAAVVLAGGQGVRMGGRKPLRAWGETTLLARALEQAATYAQVVAVSVRVASQLEGSAGAPLIEDDPSIPGPLAGLASGLEFAAQQGLEAVLTLPCDTPFLPEDLGTRLAEATERSGAAACIAASAGQWHPTCGMWRTVVLPRLRAHASDGRASLRGLAETVNAEVVTWPARPFDPFAGANTPDELTALLSRRNDHGA